MTPNGGWANGWAELYSDSDNLRMLDVGRNADGRLEVFGVNSAGNIWHTWQVTPNGGWAGGWGSRTRQRQPQSRVASNADGREVFGVNSAGNIWHTWQVTPNGGWANGWAELYSDSDNLRMLDVGRNADGRLEVFGVNSAGNIWHTWQVTPNGGWPVAGRSCTATATTCGCLMWVAKRTAGWRCSGSTRRATSGTRGR